MIHAEAFGARIRLAKPSFVVIKDVFDPAVPCGMVNRPVANETVIAKFPIDGSTRWKGTKEVACQG